MEDACSDWESVREDDADDFTGGSYDRGRVVLKLPPGGFATMVAPGGNAAAPAIALPPAARSHPSFDDATATSAATPHPCASSRGDDVSCSDHDDNTLGADFDILSVASGVVVRRCHRCTFHNALDGVVCASCGIALVANPSFDVDAQIALHLQRKEEIDACNRLLEAEREQDVFKMEVSSKRILAQMDPLYERARVLALTAAGLEIEGLHALATGDMERHLLNFIKRAMELPEPKEMSLAFKCTPLASLESIRTHGLHALELSHDLAGALAYFKQWGAMGGERLYPIQEDEADGGESDHSRCLCWIAAAVTSTDSCANRSAHPTTETLPLAYFDPSCKDVVARLDSVLLGLRDLFLLPFNSVDTPIAITGFPPQEKKERGTHTKDMTEEIPQHHAPVDDSHDKQLPGAKQDQGLPKCVRTLIRHVRVITKKSYWKRTLKCWNPLSKCWPSRDPRGYHSP